MSQFSALRSMILYGCVLVAPLFLGYSSAWVAEQWSTSRFYDDCSYGLTMTPSETTCSPGWRTYYGFPVKSQFCATNVEPQCRYPDPNDSFKEPLYVFGTDFNNTSRFTVNVFFWTFVWLPGIWMGSLLLRYILRHVRSHPFIGRS